MKNNRLVLLLLGLLLTSSAFAVDRIIITGEPATLVTTEGGTYTLPANYTVQSSNYITLDGAKRVCFAEAQPTLATLDGKVINVEVNGVATTWTCYLYDDTYFQVNP